MTQIVEAIRVSRFQPKFKREKNLTVLHHFFEIFFRIPWYQKHFQYQLYQLEKWELHPQKNPFFQDHVSYVKYWVAYKEKIPVGRIGVWIDEQYNQLHAQDDKKDTGWIGLFECINDDFTAQKLLTTALEDLQRMKVNRIIGPGRFNASSQVGLQIKGFHFKPYFMEPFNPPYYENFFASKGEKETNWFSFGVEQQSFKSYLDRIHRMETKYGSLESQLAQKGIRIYSPPKKEYAFEVNRIISLYNELWNTPSHPQFSPLLENEQNDLRKSIQLFSETSLIHIMENQKKEILGINITVPDINELFQTLPPISIQNPSIWKLYRLYYRDCKGFCRILSKTLSHSYATARVLILGTKMPGNGLDAALYKRLFEDAMKIGIKRVSASQIAETNLPMMNPLLKMGAIEKQWRVYRFQ